MHPGNTTAGSGAAGWPAPGDDGHSATIVLLAGPVKVPDRIGHHDYLAGCRVLASLLEQTPGVRAIVVRDGWPDDERVLDGARTLVVYSGGGRKLPWLHSPPRVDRLQQLIDRGVGLVAIHQAVSYPRELAGLARGWMGGVHLAGQSDRGHWPSHHRDFPPHPATRGVGAWEITDGWLREIEFVDAMRGVTPLIWSGREFRGSSRGGPADIVAWSYERPGGGRSFAYTGLDAHAAWGAAGMRRLLVNATLWTAGLPVPDAGAACAIDDGALRSYLTPRGSRGAWVRKVLRRGLRRLAKSPRMGDAVGRKP